MIELATSRSAGANLPRLSPRLLAEFPIIAPRDVDEQERIAAILDKADAVRRKRQQSLAEIDAFLRGCFNEAFGQVAAAKHHWISEPLSDIVERVTVGHVGPSSHAIRDTGVPFLRTQNIGEGEVITQDVKFVSEDFARSLPKSTLKQGDVIISRHITDQIRSAIVPLELNGANCANIVIVRPGKGVTSSYVHMLLMTEHAQTKLLERQVGSAQRVINTRAFQSWNVPRPDRDSLLRFEKLFFRVRQMRTRLDHGRAAANEFFNSLSQRAFRGEL